MTRLWLVLSLSMACSSMTWKKPPPDFVLPLAPGHYEALAIAGATYGVNFLPAKPPRLTTYYLKSVCADQRGRRTVGYITHKGNCSCGSVAPYTPHINLAWAPGMTIFDSCICEAVYEAWEVYMYGVPDVYHTTPRWVNGEAQKKIDLCRANLRAYMNVSSVSKGTVVGKGS